MDLQKASITKRAAAWLLDFILVCTLAVGFAVVLSAVFGYDAKNVEMKAAFESYGQKYGDIYAVTDEVYKTAPAEQKAAYDAVAQISNLVMNLTLVIISLALLLSVMAMEFVIPLLLKNGQTIGKKAFGIGVIRVDGVRANHMQVFVRALLGKYTVETMIPVYIVMMFFFGIVGITGTVVLFVLVVAQLICLCVTRTNSAIHDLMAGTVTVDLASQQVFATTDDLIAYTKRIHAERAKKQDY